MILPAPSRSRRLSCLRVPVLATLLLLLPTIASAVCTGDAYDEFGPMIGTWDLEADGQTIGTVEVRADEAGCSLHRAFRIGDETAQSILFIDPSDGKLNEIVVDQDGGVFRVAGTRSDGRWALVGTFTDGSGSTTDARVTIASLPNGGFRETADLRQDSAWTPFLDVRFGARGSESPTRMTSTPAPTPAPRPVSQPTRTTRSADVQPPRSSSSATGTAAPESGNERIRVSSGAEGGGATMRGQAVTKIVVDSPMLVDLQLGPIDKLPEGYAWASKDLARYEIDGATIENVEVRRKTRRGKSTLLVTLSGSSPKFTDELDVSIEVQDADGNSLSDVGEGRLYVGRGVGQQINEGTTKLKIELTTRTAELNAALASEERPKLAIKVVERD